MTRSEQALKRAVGLIEARQRELDEHIAALQAEREHLDQARLTLHASTEVISEVIATLRDPNLPPAHDPDPTSDPFNGADSERRTIVELEPPPAPTAPAPGGDAVSRHAAAQRAATPRAGTIADRVAVFLSSYPNSSAAEIGQGIGLGAERASGVLADLTKRGLVQRSGARRHYRYGLPGATALTPALSPEDDLPPDTDDADAGADYSAGDGAGAGDAGDQYGHERNSGTFAEQVRAYLAEHPGSSTGDIKNGLGSDSRPVTRALTSMHKRGRVRRRGSRGNYRFTLT